MDKVCYDLGTAPASWDFVVWLTHAEQLKRASGAKGPLRVHFKPGPNGGFRNDGLPLTAEERKGMLEHVMKPALALVGAVETVGDDGAALPYIGRPIVDEANKGHEPPKLLKGAGSPQGPVVITLREAGYWPTRNANLDAWVSFALKLQEEGERVIFIRDTAKAGEPLPHSLEQDLNAAKSLHARASLMERAKVNLMCNNGPTVLAICSAAPYAIFKQLDLNSPATTPLWWAENIGVAPGTQYPWALPSQILTWEQDTPEALTRAWLRLKPLLNSPDV